MSTPSPEEKECNLEMVIPDSKGKDVVENITKEEIRMWFDILCERCNKQIYHHGTCYYGRKNGHSYKVKSSKRIDEFLDLISLNLGEYKEKGLIPLEEFFEVDLDPERRCQEPHLDLLCNWHLFYAFLPKRPRRYVA